MKGESLQCLNLIFQNVLSVTSRRLLTLVMGETSTVTTVTPALSTLSPVVQLNLLTSMSPIEKACCQKELHHTKIRRPCWQSLLKVRLFIKTRFLEISTTVYSNVVPMC